MRRLLTINHVRGDSAKYRLSYKAKREELTITLDKQKINSFHTKLMAALRIFLLFGITGFFSFSLSTSSAQTLIGSGIDYATPAKYRIAGLTVVGSEYTDPQAIKLFSGLQEGDEVMIPGERISDAIRKLWKQKLFTDISITVAEFRGDEAFLVINLTESPRLTVFKLDGIKKSEADNLREKLDLRTNTIANDNVINNAITTIKKFYVDKGYYHSTVSVKEEADPKMQNGVRLIFNINRGNRVKIEEIVFEGVGENLAPKDFLFIKGKKPKPVMTEAQLKRTMKNTKERSWRRIFKSSKFIDKEFDADKEKIIARYNKEGFRNARIVSDELYAINSERIGLRIKIEEDKRFYFRNISFVGNTKYRSSTLDSILNIEKGDVYNMQLFEQRLNFNPQGRDVSSLYSDDGYLAYYAYPVETLIDPDSIDIEIRITEGKQFRIGKVGVKGNTKTNDHVIYREIRTWPGDLFSRSDIMRTQRELMNLGYFSQEGFNVETNPRPEEGLVDIVYVVEEKPNDQIQLSGGWGGGRVVGTLGLSFSNFSTRNFFKKNAWSPLPTGDGQRLSLNAASNGTYYQAYSLSFTEPWLGGKKPNSLSFALTHSRQTNGYRRNEAGLKELKVSGGSMSFGKRLKWPDDYFLLYSGISYQLFNLNDYEYFFGDEFKDLKSHNLAATFTLLRSSTSEPIYPVSGSTLTLSAKATVPYSLFGEKILGKEYDYENMTTQERYGWVEYYKLKFTAQWYTALNKHKDRKFVLYNNVGFGLLGSYNYRLGESPFERFYLGGVYLSGYLLDGREIVNLRGYDDLSLTNSTNANGGAPGIVKYTSEIRYPLSTNPNATIYTLGFIEAGNTWANLRDFNPYDIYRSAGVGVRIYLPMFGLLGFDYGWRLDNVPTLPNMQRGQFHFSIGANMGEL